jgi:hypothetical protein
MKNVKAPDALLDNLYIASPCTVPWSSMQGDDRTRLCGGCTRNVYNISDMTKQEAEEFLRCNGTTHCMVLFRRQDGTVLTDDCPVALRKLRDRCKMIARCVGGFLAFLLAMPASFAQSSTTQKKNPIPEQLAGEAVVRTAQPTTKPEQALLGAPAMPPQHPQLPNNPAGGARIIPQNRITPTAGKPSVMPHPAQPALGNSYQLPSGQNQPNGTSNPQANIKLSAEKNLYLSTAAYDYYRKGQEATAKSQTSLAEFYYEKALEAYDQQKVGDTQFRKLIEASLNALRATKKH